MKILGIDYGLKNLGFALAETPLANPYTVVKVSSLQDAISRTLRIIQLVKPDLLVVGMPEGQLAPMVATFVKALRPLLDIDIKTHPETLSSQEAIAKLRAVGATKSKLAMDHAYAAALILEDYLEANPTLVKV